MTPPQRCIVPSSNRERERDFWTSAKRSAECGRKSFQRDFGIPPKPKFSALRIISGWRRRWKNRRGEADGIFTISSPEIRSHRNRFWKKKNNLHLILTLYSLKNNFEKIEKRKIFFDSYYITFLRKCERKKSVRICDDRFDTFGGERINERSRHRCLIIISGRPTLLYNQPTGRDKRSPGARATISQAW